jgi:hypothetical protein
MRRLWVGGIGAVLLLAVGAAVAPATPPKADDDDDKPAAKPAADWNPFIAKVFGLNDPKPAPKPDKEKDKEKDPKREAAPAPRPSAMAQAAASLRALEMKKLLRRQEVCLRLREIAAETHDDDLERKAEELDARAWQVYQEHTKNIVGGAEADVTARLTAPSRRSGSRGTDDTASLREVRP